MTTSLFARERIKPSPKPRKLDKRYFPRWDVNKRVEYGEEGKEVIRSYTKDLSLDGASLLVLGHPPARHRVQLRIYLADKVIFKAKGRVTWSKSEPTYKLIGIAFEDLSKKAEGLIMRHAFEIRTDDLLIHG